MDLSSLLSSVGDLFSSPVISGAGATSDLSSLTDLGGTLSIDPSMGTAGLDFASLGGGTGIDPSMTSALGSMGYTLDPSGGIIPISGGQSAGFLNGDPLAGIAGGTSGGGTGNLLSSLLGGGNNPSVLGALGLGTGNGLTDASLLSALGALGTGIMGSNTASNAANLQYQAANNAMNMQQGNFNTILGNMTPYNQAGQGAIGSLAPYGQTGTAALGALAGGLGLNGGSGNLVQNFTPNLTSAPAPNLGGLNPNITPTVGPNLPGGIPSVNQTIGAQAPTLPTVSPTLGGIAIPQLSNFQIRGSAPNVTPNTSGSIPQWTSTLGDLSKLPGYQFTLDQGTQATLNYLSGQGLGVSGAAGKALANYAEGLAGTYVPQYANLAMNQQQLNLQAQNQAFGQQQQGFTNWLNNNQLGMSAANLNYNQQQSNFQDAMAQATGLYAQNQQGFQNAVTQAGLGLDYGQANFGQQQQQMQNYQNLANLGLNYGTTNFGQQQQGYTNAINQLSGLFGQQFQNYGTQNSLALQQGGMNLAQALQQYNMLSGTAGGGQNALGSILNAGTSSMNPLGNFGSSMGSSIAGLLTGGANALASGQVGSTNALTGGINSALTNLNQASLLPLLMAQMGLGGTTSNALGA